MKKLSLLMILTLIGTVGFSQVIFQVQAPSTPANLRGSYTILDWALQSNGWSSPDMTVPANAITGALEYVDDGEPGLDPNGRPNSRDACTAGSNPGLPITFVQPSLAGKIAVINRGTCQFGHKAKIAQDNGAIGVVIISHLNDPIGMLGGDSGLAVTIPVIIISKNDGLTLENAIDSGYITQAFIGNKLGLFADDLGSKQGDVLRARRFSNLAALSQNATEFSVPVGAWVRNLGSSAQSGGQLKCVIDNGTQVYADSAIIPTLAPVSGQTVDSVFVPLSTFSQSSYTPGYYDMTYTITTNPNTDMEQSDNVIEADFMISDSLYSYGSLDRNTNEPLSPTGFRSSTFTSDWEGCLAFQDPNASRLRAIGMTFSATTSGTASLANEFAEVRVYEWNDAFTDINDPNLSFSTIVQSNPLRSAFYIWPGDYQDSNIYVPFAPIPLVDNQRYLFCMNSTSDSIFLGYDNKANYLTTQNDATYGHLQPSIPGSVDGGFVLNGFGIETPIAVSVKFDNFVGIDEIDGEIDIVPFPNPTTGELNIPVGNRNGQARFEIFDVAGKLVMSKVLTFSNNDVLKIDVSAIESGFYVGNMTFDNDVRATFNIVVK